MAATVPKTTKQWTVDGKGFDKLNLSEAEIPRVHDNQVLVKFHAASLNYRDLMVAKGHYGESTLGKCVPLSDGAGEVVAVGQDVDLFKVGDRVATMFCQKYLGGEHSAVTRASALGQNSHGTLRQYGAFDQNGLVHLPSTLSYVEGSTLPCAALTAWNALFGVTDKQLTAGQWVLTQGTGGVSMFALQFAKSVGARVVATTSSPEKAARLKELGADHVINYKDTPEWGAKAKELTGGQGANHVVEVSGPQSMAQSIEAVKHDGVVTIIGHVGGMSGEKEPSFLQCLLRGFTARGILVGSRVQMQDMCNAFEANPEKLKPIVDAKVFSMEEVREAYQYQMDNKHFGKVVIKIE